MKKMSLLLMAMVCLSALKAQYTYRVLIKDAASKVTIVGATVQLQPLNKTAVSGTNGYAAIHNLSAGRYAVVISHTGYEIVTDSIQLPMAMDTATVYLEQEEEEMEEVVVQTTRTSRTIKNTPARIETISGEELDEKNNMRPSNVSMLLHESTGIQVQQTSATNANASIRMQGLDGRYTQLLKDGYPNFGNFAAGLSILEIPPLDLKQVEVMKGPASTLYGGGAIAGVVNFVSKNPTAKFAGDFIANQSNIGQTTIGGFISQRHKKIGYTLLAQYNTQKVYDVDDDGFTEIPKTQQATVHPRLFFYPDDRTTIMLGNNYSWGSNLGGDVQAIKGNASPSHVYFEKNKTNRNTTTAEYSRKWGQKNSFNIKQSLTVFNRSIEVPGYLFSGRSTNSYSELSVVLAKPQHLLITGANFIYDQFAQQNASLQNTKTTTGGVYLQDTWDVTDRITLENGVRVDYVSFKASSYTKNQVFVLPRVSALFKMHPKWVSRISGGLGYKVPTIFNEQTESQQYRGILPLSNVKAERSAGATADVNYSTRLGGVLNISVNQLFFYTVINSPLVLQPDNLGNSFFANSSDPMVSTGFETNLKFIYKHDLKLFAGYTFTNAKAKYQTGNQFIVLQPRHKVNLTLMYEKEDNFKFGLEGYYTGKQYLTNGSATPNFWEFGFMAQKTWNKISFYVNFENFTDQRQSNYKGVANPPLTNPSFDEIWNHTEGFVLNGGIKVKL